jgi:hypothetical protein
MPDAQSAARVWREDDEPWLTFPPLIEMLDERSQKREPHPITWAEQSKLLQRLPGHLQRMVEFAVNTGARDENACVVCGGPGKCLSPN